VGAAVLEQAAEEWRAIAYSTEPTDRHAAEAAVTELYELTLGGTQPEIVWCQSPVEAAWLIVADPARFGEPARGVVRDQPWEAARAEFVARLGMAEFAKAWQTTCGELAPEMSQLTRRIAAGVAEQGADEARQIQLRVTLTHALHGQHDAAWLPVFEGTDDPIIAAIAQVAHHTGWWWPFQNNVILTDRPTELHRDDLGRLHHGGGPALAYGDGFALHSWNGTAITADFSARMAALDPTVIRAEANAELRRMMLEHFGYERFVAESGATPIQKDAAGKLWRIELTDDEPIVMVEVVNSTAEPDGTFNTYWLRVPPATVTAKAGVAWTFGLEESEYRPLAQT
jgi:hypothetical protein